MKKKAKYEIIYQDLTAKILNGSFPDGKLPPVAELTKQYSASLLTVNNAVKLLAENGFVTRSSGRGGTRINQPGLRHINLNRCNGNTWDGNPEIYSCGKVTLRYLTEQSGSFMPSAMPSIIKFFEKRYPWIHVEQDFSNSADFLQRSDHDIIQASHSAILPLIYKEQLLDLSPYFKHFGRINRCLHDNCTVPLMMSMPFFYCNDPEIKKSPENWQQFMELNTRLQKEKKCSALLLGFFSSLHFFIGDVSKNLLDNRRKNDFIRLIEIMRSYYQWEMPWNNFSPSDILNAVKQQKISFFAGYCSSTILQMSNNLKITPLPHSGSYLAETVRIGISKSCPHPTEAWLFINFLRSKAVQKKLVDTSYGIPYHAEVLHQDFKQKFPAIYNAASPLFDKIFESCISNSTRNMIYHVAYPLLEECFAGNVCAEKCISIIREAINELIILDRIENNY